MHNQPDQDTPDPWSLADPTNPVPPRARMQSWLRHRAPSPARSLRDLAKRPPERRSKATLSKVPLTPPLQSGCISYGYRVREAKRSPRLRLRVDERLVMGMDMRVCPFHLPQAPRTIARSRAISGEDFWQGGSLERCVCVWIGLRGAGAPFFFEMVRDLWGRWTTRHPIATKCGASAQSRTTPRRPGAVSYPASIPS